MHNTQVLLLKALMDGLIAAVHRDDLRDFKTQWLEVSTALSTDDHYVLLAVIVQAAAYSFYAFITQQLHLAKMRISDAVLLTEVLPRDDLVYYAILYKVWSELFDMTALTEQVLELDNLPLFQYFYLRSEEYRKAFIAGRTPPVTEPQDSAIVDFLAENASPEELTIFARLPYFIAMLPPTTLLAPPIPNKTFLDNDGRPIGVGQFCLFVDRDSTSNSRVLLITYLSEEVTDGIAYAQGVSVDATYPQGRTKPPSIIRVASRRATVQPLLEFRYDTNQRACVYNEAPRRTSLYGIKPTDPLVAAAYL